MKAEIDLIESFYLPMAKVSRLRTILCHSKAGSITSPSTIRQDYCNFSLPKTFARFYRHHLAL